MNMIITLLALTTLAWANSELSMGQRLQQELSYLDSIAKNPTVYKTKSKKIVTSKRNSEDYLKLEDVFEGKDELTTSLSAPKRDRDAESKPFKPTLRSRE